MSNNSWLLVADCLNWLLVRCCLSPSSSNQQSETSIPHGFSIASRFALNSVPCFHSGHFVPCATR